MADTSAGIGYQAGDGGAVAQATSKSTAVTLDKPNGRITMNNAALAANTTVTFQLNSTAIGSTDNVIVTVSDSITTAGSYQVWASDTRSGFCQINVRNITGVSLSNALIMQYAVIKGSVA